MTNFKDFKMKKILITIILGIFLVSLISAVGEASSCCERLKSNGAWCQNAPVESCDVNYRKVPTSCESTSYCKLGTCVDSQEGTCIENTPEKVCEDGGGIWKSGEPDEIPQCQLGCCLIGDQAAFVTQTRCRRLSLLYGLEINFRTDFGSEIQCIASATSEVKGACVFEKESENTCLFTTKKKCSEMSGSDKGTEFHEGYLCSAESLATNCGPSEKTTCVEGRDEVYFLDGCGNLANIYDASKIKDKNYWAKVKRKDESCNSEYANADSTTCGNCDYFLGSTCKTFERGQDKIRPNFGDSICRDLSCEYEGKKYSHGETWCADSKGIKNSLPGSRSFRLVCYNGEVSVEPCADFRQETCIESDINGFSTAACRVNMWQNCYSQTEKEDCENTDKRDCFWNPSPGTAIKKDKDNEKLMDESDTACFPKYAPGFNFWEAESESKELCSKVDTQCVVKYEKKFGGSKKCVENCYCLDADWKKDMENTCASIGDCGSSTNYLGVPGFND